MVDSVGKRRRLLSVIMKDEGKGIAYSCVGMGKRKKYSYLLTSHVKQTRLHKHASRNSILIDSPSFCPSWERMNRSQNQTSQIRLWQSRNDELASELFAWARKKKSCVGRKISPRGSIGERRYSQTVQANFSH